MKNLILTVSIAIAFSGMAKSQNWNYSYSYVDNNYNTSYMNNGWGNYYTGYSNYNYARQWSKQIIRGNAFIIKQALRFFGGNPFAAPYLNEAVNHQLYAKHLWRMGYYDDAAAHSNFAAEIANDVMQPNAGFCGDNEGDMYSPGLRKRSDASNSNPGNRNSSAPQINQELKRKMENPKLKLPAQFNKDNSSLKPDDDMNVDGEK